MQLQLRPYAGAADLQQMLALAKATKDNIHTLDLPYRLSSWALDDPQNIGIWLDEYQQLAGWAVMQTPMWAVDYAYAPVVDGATFHAQLLPWVDRRAQELLKQPGGHPMWFVNVRPEQAERIRALEAAGFACQADVPENPWRKVFFVRSAQTPLGAAARPAGFTIRPLAGAQEVDAYVELHRAAFGSTNMTAAWRRRVLEHAAYRPDLDIVASTEAGRLVAFCIGWFDATGFDGKPGGQIEPLGVHPDFQGQGIGRAVLQAVIQRLHDLGAAQVYVEADESDDGAFPFYQSCGFQVAHPILVYRKDYRPAQA